MLQHGAYTLLIDACYDREVFPTLEDAIDWVWASSDAEIDAVKFVLKKFFIADGGIYIQDRIQEDLEKYFANNLINKRIAIDRERKKKLAKINKKSTKGEQKSTERERVVNDNSNLLHETAPNQEPSTINQEPLTKNHLKDQSAKANEPFEIFTYWKEVMKKNNSAKLTTDRLSKVKARIKEGYTIDEIKMAVLGCSLTPHNMGDNDRNEKYNCLSLICRNGSNIERFANNSVNPPKSSVTRDINAIGDDFSAPEGWNS